MGCTASKDAALFDALRLRFPKTLSVLELQQFSAFLMNRFIEKDSGGNLHLSFPDFLAFGGVPDNRVTRRLFAISDADGSQSLDFREAIFLVWQLCTLDAPGLVQFLFDIYDEVNNGLIEYDDIEDMLSDAYGAKNLESADIQEFVEYTKKKGVLSRPEFTALCERMAQVSRVIMDTQRRMRAALLGRPVWLYLERRRAQKTDPLFRPENWGRLMEKIIGMELAARDEQAKRDKEYEMRTGRKVKHAKGGKAEADDRVRYEP
jgi:Ca2+-binding EF-hand superfamily protein